MPRSRRFQNNFTTGEVSPDLHERYDFAKRENALATMRNCILRPQGGAIKRNGTRFVAKTKDALGSDSVRLIPFVFSRLQAYVLEFGNFYLRFYRDNGQLVDGALPVELTTPWSISQVQDLDFAQEADTMVLVHPETEPQVLSRYSDTNWKLNPLNVRPVPTEQVGHTDPTATVTLALVSGINYSITSNVAIFTVADIGRTFAEQGESATGRGVISSVTSTLVANMDVLEAFSSLTLTVDPNGDSEWILEGSPLAGLGILKTSDGKQADGTRGEQVTLSAYKTNDSASLTGNSDFASGLTFWTDVSGRTIFSDTHEGAGGTTLISENDLRAEGVRPNHLIVNATSSPQQEGLVSSVGNDTGTGTEANNTILTVNDAITWTTGDVFVVKDTGRTRLVTVSGVDGVELIPGENGVAAIRQAFNVSAYGAYEYEVTSADDNVSIKVGTDFEADDVLEEVSLSPGNHKGIFFAPAGASTLVFTIRNNQFNTSATVFLAAIRDITANAFAYQVEQGDFIRLNGGYLEALETGTDNTLKGNLITALDDAENAIAGSWTAEKSQWRDEYPSHAAFYQQRLLLTWGLKIGGTRVGEFRNFAFGSNANDAFEFRPAATEVNPPLWIVGEQSLVIGTRGEEFVVAGTETGFLSAADLSAFSPSAEGTEDIKPQRATDSLLFVKSGGRRVIEFRYVPGTVDPVSKDLNILANHLLVPGDKLTGISWQKEPEQILWCVSSQGKLFSLSYVRSQDIWAWATHDSEDNATYKAIAVIPHPDGDRDQLWVLVNRGIGSQEYIEYFDDAQGFYDENLATMTDSTLRYSGASTTTITGLSHLEGLDCVWVVDEQGPQGPYTVTGGQINFDREVTESDVGLLFIAEIETLRPSIEGSSPTGLIIGNTNLYARFRNTGAGVEGNGKTLKRRGASELMDSRIEPLTGELELPTVGHDRDATVNIQQTIPETFHLLSIAGTIDFETP